MSKPRIAEVDLTATYIDSDMDAEAQLPLVVRDYWMRMNVARPVAARFILESVQLVGIAATLQALRDYAMESYVRETVY